MASLTAFKLFLLMALLATSCTAQSPTGAPTVSPTAAPVAPPTATPSPVPVAAPTPAEDSPAPAPAPASPSPNGQGPAAAPGADQPPADGNSGFASSASFGGAAITAVLLAVALA